MCTPAFIRRGIGTGTFLHCLEPRAADITWDYKKVKGDSIGITEKCLGLQSDSKKGHKVVWDSIGVLKKRVGITFRLQK